MEIRTIIIAGNFRMVYFVLKSITRISLHNNVNNYVLRHYAELLKFKYVVHTKICTTENYLLYSTQYMCKLYKYCMCLGQFSGIRVTN